MKVFRAHRRLHDGALALCAKVSEGALQGGGGVDRVKLIEGTRSCAAGGGGVKVREGAKKKKCAENDGERRV